MNVCIQADAVAVGRALIAALLFVGERAASFSEAKFDDTAFGSVLKRWRTHWTSKNWPEQFVETGSTRFLQKDFMELPGVLASTQLRWKIWNQAAMRRGISS